ncbi:hypothetical protein DF186_21040, partial [Enterococcus hirae]
PQVHVRPVGRRDELVVVAGAPQGVVVDALRRLEVAAQVVREAQVVADVRVVRAARDAVLVRGPVGLDLVRDAADQLGRAFEVG